MQCEQIEQRLGAFLDGELPPAELESVRTHLLTCGRCQQALRELQSVGAFLAGYEDEAMPPSLESSLASIGAGPRGWLRWARNISLAASVAAAFYMGVFLSGEFVGNTGSDTTYSFGDESLYTLYQEVGQ